MLRRTLQTALAVTTIAAAGAPAAEAKGRLILKPEAAGWTLLTPDGDIVFRASGADGKRQCLSYALARGAIRVS